MRSLEGCSFRVVLTQSASQTNVLHGPLNPLRTASNRARPDQGGCHWQRCALLPHLYRAWIQCWFYKGQCPRAKRPYYQRGCRVGVWRKLYLVAKCIPDSNNGGYVIGSGSGCCNGTNPEEPNP